MNPPKAVEPSAFAVEDYLQRSAKSNRSVKLTTVDAEGRVGVIVVYQGQLWSARDTLGAGHSALLRLMNTPVVLRVERLAEVDRGPRNVTERREVLFLEASFQPRNDEELPTLVANPKLAPPATIGALPPAPRLPNAPNSGATSNSQEPGHAAFPSEPEAPTLASRDVLSHLVPSATPTTLRSLVVQAENDGERPSAANDEGRVANHVTLARLARPRRHGWRMAWEVAAIVTLGSSVALLSSANVSSSRAGAANPLEPGPTSATDDPPRGKHPLGVTSVAEGTASNVKREFLAHEPTGHTGDSEPVIVSPASLADAPRPVVARVRSVSSTESLHGADLPRYVYSITGQLLTCYDWATQRSGRSALGQVSVRVQLDEQGQVVSSTATGAKVRGLNRCVADVAARLPALANLPRSSNTLSWTVVFEH